MAGCHAAAQYVPRSTQDCDALALVREHWPAFRDRLEERAGRLPTFVPDELDALLTCGDFEHGFLVAECQRCGDSLRVPFACKSRGICPSCMGRRMAETAALLVEHRLPAGTTGHCSAGYASGSPHGSCRRFAGSPSVRTA